MNLKTQGSEQMGQTCAAEARDTRFRICGASRRIKSLTGRKLILVQRDHNSTKMVFEMPTCGLLLERMAIGAKQR